MASKHSKSFFDFRKRAYIKPSDSDGAKALSLPIKIIIAVLVASLVLSSVFVGWFFIKSSSHTKLLSKAKTIFDSMPSGEAINTLAQENDDIKGWIKIEGTEIDCAVCQGDDDEFYANHNQLGKKSRYGALFLSKNDSFERTGGDRNIAIFGNNMKDGSMFGTLKKYRNLQFYKQHPFINLYYGEESEIYVVFAVMLLPSDEEMYQPTVSHFANEEAFDAWYSESCARSLITSTVKVEYGDDVLTLVTAAKDFDGARLAVMAKKIDEWEAEHTDVSQTKVNSNTKYPMAWYNARGREYPY